MKKVVYETDAVKLLFVRENREAWLLVYHGIGDFVLVN